MSLACDEFGLTELTLLCGWGASGTKLQNLGEVCVGVMNGRGSSVINPKLRKNEYNLLKKNIKYDIGPLKYFLMYVLFN